MKRTILLFVASLSLIAAENPFDAGKWIDLSHDFSKDTIYWPTEPGFVLEENFHGKTEKGYFYAANKFICAEHGGTHLDAPIHFSEQGKTADQLELTQLTGLAVVIDITKKTTTNPLYEISSADLLDWEKKEGRIPDGAILLLRTGFSKHWPNAEKYLGTAEKGAQAVAKLKFPGLAPEAARWLNQNRLVRAVGIDTASIDFGQSTLFESHRILFEKNIPVFENVTGLEQLPIKGAYVVALPMKIKGGSGGPLRIIAWVRNSP